MLALIFVAVFSVYLLATQLSPPDQGISSSVKKLTLTSNLLSSLIEADGMARAFISTNDSVYHDQYQKQQKITQHLIDSLTLSSISNTNQFLRMLVVDSLMEMKRVTYNNFFTLRKINNPYKTVDLSKIGKRYDTIRVATKTTTAAPDETVTVITEEPKKKGFFTRIWDNLTNKSEPDTVAVAVPTEVVTYDTVISYKAVLDTTLSQVKKQLRRMAAAESYERQMLAEREMQLVQADQDIMNEIRAVLLLFEKEEIAKAISGTEKSGKILNNLWTIALILAAFGLLTTIGFIIMIWKDLARSAFYRKQSEQARALAESLLKVKEQFLANMSHEIRTPLTSIIGFTERLSETHISNEQSKYIRYINSSSEHLLELINDLLDFSRIGSGKLTLESKTFNIVQLFEEAYDSLSSRAKDKGLEIILKQNIPPLLLKGDPLRIRQIVINLLGNSVKFTEKGKVMLQTKGTLSANGETVNLIIRIADTGIGIPEDKLKSIFEEFSQVDHSITRKYGGSGLGLAISRRLIQMMTGTISVLSREEQGTIFTIRLALPVSAETVIDSRQVDNVIHPNLKNSKILLAEDDVTTNALITEFLQGCNAEVYSTTNGNEALRIFKENPGTFEIIITDIQMPGKSGPQLVQDIKEVCNSNNLKLPIIIGLTAHADTSETQSFIKNGMDYFILKPFKNQDIKEVLNTLSSRLGENSSAKSNPTFRNGQTYRQNVKDGHESRAKRESSSRETLNSKESPILNPDLNNLEPETINLLSFKEFTGDDEDSLNTIVLSLQDNIRRTSAEMQAAFDKSDFVELSLLAHRILPNIRLLGTRNTAAVLRELEIKTKEESADETGIKNSLKAAIRGMNLIGEQLRLLAKSKP